jgi:hypothetical protein
MQTLESILRRQASERCGMTEKSIDFFRWMPCNAFDILGMFHENTHALEVGVRLD